MFVPCPHGRDGEVGLPGYHKTRVWGDEHRVKVATIQGGTTDASDMPWERNNR